LIKEISENPEVITRDYYVSQYTNRRLVEIGAADEDFDDFAEKGQQHISSSKLNENIRVLDEEVEHIKNFRDQWIAHFDQNREIERLPTFEDIENASEVIDDIFCKYQRFLTRAGMLTRKPALAFDWREPLRHAWIEENANL
jgi:hypothetical protein